MNECLCQHTGVDNIVKGKRRRTSWCCARRSNAQLTQTYLALLYIDTFHKRVAMLFRLTYMELDILCVVRLWIFSRGSLLKHKMCCVYSGAHLLAVNFINSHMRLNGRQLSRKTLDKLIYSIPLSSLWLCYLFSFTLELIIRRWIQFNSNTFSCSSSFVVCRVS